ncbi:hypothetical protein SDC9_116777 [bioreactor metagenome]|uniref:Uncharacterized protein n=1 Tax=bioreactor metagenome TaxID=1076179 RepID=A0A645BWQ6_9ZZZZ
MSAGLAEDGAEQLAGAVGDRGLRGEAGVAGHEDADPGHTGDGVEAAGHRGGRGEGVEGGGPGQVLALFGGQVRAELAGVRQRAGHQRQLAGGGDERALPLRRDVRPDRGRHRRQRQPELGEPGGGGHVASLSGRFR